MTSAKTELKITPVIRPSGCLLQLEGVLDHTLDATKLGGSGGGVLIIDLEGVRRVSSNGVREWIRALRATSRTYLGFVHAHPSLVSQFNMVNKFSAGGELLSFYAPYVCNNCKREFETIIDVRRQFLEISSLDAPAASCPTCGGEGTFDDMPSSYFSYVASSPRPDPPAAVDSLLTAGAPAPGSAFKVDKEVQGTTTALRFVGVLDAHAHLKRVADGLEGRVLLMLDGVTNSTPEGIDRLTPLLAAEGLEFLLARVPIPLADALSARVGQLGASKVVSFLGRLECSSCRSGMYFEIDADQLDGSSATAARVAGCDECGTENSLSLSTEVIARLSRLSRLPVPAEMSSYLTRRSSTLPVEPKTPVARGDAQQFGRFKLFQKIGSGGMAEVFLAVQTGAAGFAKSVVVKRILPQLATDRQFVDMFLQEARLASRVSHPNVVEIYDLGEMAGSYFIAMEHVRGWDLNTILHRASETQYRFPVELAAHVMIGICAGLQAAHTSVDEAGNLSPIIHRDVSPHNVLISHDGQVKLADFGIAKAVNAGGTPTTGIKGKLAYMAPEQLSSGTAPLDARIDLFAAGIVFFQLLTFTHPFQGETEFLTLKAVLEGKPPDVKSLRSNLPPVVETIVQRALQRDAALRYQTALEMQRDLEQLIATPKVEVRLADWLTELIRLTAGMPNKLQPPLGVTFSLVTG